MNSPTAPASPTADPQVAAAKAYLATTGYQPPAANGAPSWQSQISSPYLKSGSDTTAAPAPTPNPFSGGAGDMPQKPTDATTQPFKNGLSTVDPTGAKSDALINGVLPGVEGLGNEAAAAIGAPSAQANADQINNQKDTNLQLAIKVRNQLQASGHDTSDADQMIQSLMGESPAQVSDVLPAVNDTPEQVLGNAAGVATDIIGAGALPGAADTAAASGIAKGALAGAKVGAGFGAAQGAAGAMANNEDAGGVIGSGVMGGAAGAAGGAVLGGTIGGVSNALTPKDPVAAATDLISQDPETMTQGMKNEAVEQGRMVETPSRGGNAVSYKPTAQIERAGKILSDPAQVSKPIVEGDSASTVVAKVKSAVSSKGAAAEAYLDANPEYVSNKESADMIASMKQKASRVLEPQQLDAYNNQLDLFQKQLEDQSAKSGTLNTSDYYRALKSYEDNIGNQIARGKDAIIDPTGVGSARIRAAADIRSTVRDMIGEKNPGFQPQMQDLASLYEARDNAIFNAGKTKSTTFLQNHPKTKIAAEAVGALAGGTALTEVGKRVITGSF